jgi:hypothetical protein
MKLAKKNNVPVLSFEIFGTTNLGRRVKVAHDVRIEVMKPADAAMLTEPRCPEPDVRLLSFFVCRRYFNKTRGIPGPDHASTARKDARRCRTHAFPLGRDSCASQLVRLSATFGKY